jgi:phage terminase small subunit
MPSKKPKPLSARQKRFVEEYLIDQNASAAYVRAGYKDSPYAHKNAARLKANDGIRAAIDAGLKKIADAKGLVAERIWDEWRCIGLSDIGDIIDFTGADAKLRPANEIPEHARRAIASVKVKRYVEGDGDSARTVEILEFKLWDKPGVLRDAAKARELFKEKLEICRAVEIVGIEVISQPRRSVPGNQ